MVMKSMGFRTDKVKLSGLIDESFFDEIAEAEEQTDANFASKRLLGKRESNIRETREL